MNKYYTAFLQDYNLTYDAKEKMFYGNMNGFQVSGTVSTFSSVNLLSFHVYVPEERTGEVGQFLFGIQKSYGVRDFNVVGDGIVLTVANSPKKYRSCAEAVANYLTVIETKGGCPFCGEDVIEESRLVGSACGIYRAHERCFDEYAQKVSAEEATEKAAPNKNLLKAIGGMALGALAGCVVWIIFSALGLISYWAPLISAFLGAYLWDRFGGKNDKFKIILLWVVTLVLLTLTIFLTYYVMLSNVAAEAGYTMAEAWPIWMESEEFTSALIQDIVISYVFILVANIVVTVQVAQTQKLMSKSFRKF